MAPAAVTLHLVAVLRPPHTCSTSSPVKSRAPLRANTLFWSFMFFSFHHIGSLSGPELVKKRVFMAKRLLIGAAALAVEGISVERAGCSQSTCGQRPEPTGYHRDFMLIQITSALASQHS